MKKIKKILSIFLVASLLNTLSVAAVYSTETGIDVAVTTGKTGNIFYTDENAEFKVEIKNDLSEEQDITVTTNVYLLNEADDRYRIDGESQVVHASSGATVLEYYDYTDTTGQYGRYIFSITLSGGVGELNLTKEFEFSRSVYNQTQNTRFGINSHLQSGRGNPDILLPLAQNAGVGNLRETFNWESYELTPGDYALTETQKATLQAAQKYGFEPLIILYGNNKIYDKGDFVTPDNMKNYKAYITNILKEEEMADVKKIEVYNEPDYKKDNYNGVTITDTASKSAAELRGEYYGEMLTNAYDAIKAVNQDIQVYGLSFCQLADTTNTPKFLAGVAAKVNQYSAANGGKLPFDKVSLHPYVSYQVESDTSTSRALQGKTYHEIVEYYKAEFDDLISADTDFAVTEYGFTITDEDVGCEHTQAALDLRAYLLMRTGDFNRDIYLYDLMNDGVDKSEREHNFGLLQNESYRVPYAAKAGYLATSALNLFTGSATEAKLEKQSDGFVAEFIRPNGTTYVLWNNTDGTVDVDLPDNVIFYDMYGNSVAKPSDNGSYPVSTTPYYAVTDDLQPAPSDRKDNYIKIAGLVDSGESGLDVSLTIFPSGVSTDEGTAMVASFVYLNQSKTYEDGKFEFRVMGLEEGKEYTAYIKAGDRSEAVIQNFTIENYIDYIKLYSVGEEVKTLSTIDMRDAYLEIDQLSAGSNYQAFCVCYKDEIMVYLAKNNDDNVTDNGEGKIRINVSTDQTLDYDTVKLFLWDMQADVMMPLCGAKVFD